MTKFQCHTSGIAEAFQRFAAEFGAAKKQWEKEHRQRQRPKVEDVDERMEWSEFLEQLDPVTQAHFKLADNINQKHRLRAKKQDSFMKCRPVAARAGRLSLNRLDSLESLAPIRADAASINLGDDDAIAGFWWDKIVPHVLGVKAGGRQLSASNKLGQCFENGALTCERLAEELQGGDRDIEKVRRNTPSLDKGNGQWIRASLAAQLENLETRTLTNYRSKGLKSEDNMFGMDRDGRIWRRLGSPNTHPWYFVSSLISKRP